MAFNCSDVNFYALNLVMRRENLLEVEASPSPVLGWGEVVPEASHNSWKPKLCETLWLFSLCVQIMDKLVREIEWPVELPSFRAVDGREGSCWEKPWQ